MTTVDPEGKPVFIIFEESKPSFINNIGDKFTINLSSNAANGQYPIIFRLSDGTVKSVSYYQFNIIIINRPPFFL